MRSGTETGSEARGMGAPCVSFEDVEINPAAGDAGNVPLSSLDGDMLAATLSDVESSSLLFGSGLGPAAAFSSRGRIMSLRVTRNPRTNMHWSSGRS